MSVTRFSLYLIKTGGRGRRAQEDEESGEESEEEEEVKKSSATEGLIEVSPPLAAGPLNTGFVLSQPQTSRVPDLSPSRDADRQPECAEKGGCQSVPSGRGRATGADA